MAAAFDPRIVQVSLQFPNDMLIFKDLNISATGRKFGTAIMNQCNVRISNLTTAHKNYILTQASILKKERTPIKVLLDIGRESYGTFRLYEGDSIAALSSQPPDIGVTLQSLTNNALAGLIKNYSMEAPATLQQIAQMVATSNGLILNFQAEKAANKKIDNYSFTGAASKQVAKLCELGNVNAYVDNNLLVVLDIGSPIDTAIRVINSGTGMVGVPEVTEKGVRVRMMIDNSIKLFSRVQVISEVNPAANGLYDITQLNFEVSNRDNPFWYIIEALTPDLRYGGNV